MRKIRKAATAAALLLLLSACGSSAEVPTPSRNDAVELVAYTQSEAFELCRTLPEDMIQECLTAAADW